MDSFEWNKVAGAVFLSGLIAMVVGNIAYAIYRPDVVPEKRGYAIEVVETSGESAAAAPAKEVLNIGALLAAADVSRGETLFKKCAACHSVEKGGPNKVGPNLWGIVNADIAHLTEGYSYSKAMAAAEGKWDYAALFEFLKKPSKYIPGTKMAFAGISKPEQRADMIMYLRDYADAKAAIPAPSAPIVEEVVEAVDDAVEAAEEVVDSAVEGTVEAVEDAVDASGLPATLGDVPSAADAQ